MRMARRPPSARTAAGDALRRKPPSRPHSVRLHLALERELQSAAARAGVSVSDFIRQAVMERLEQALGSASLWERLEPILEELPERRETTDVASHTHAAFEEGLASRHSAVSTAWPNRQA